MKKGEIFSTIFMLLGTFIFLRCCKILFGYSLKEREPTTLDTLYSIENSPNVSYSNIDKARVFLIATTVAAIVQALSSTLALARAHYVDGGFRRFFLGIDFLMFLSLFGVLFVQYVDLLESLFELIGLNVLLLLFSFILEYFANSGENAITSISSSKRKRLISTIESRSSLNRNSDEKNRNPSISETIISVS